MKYLLNVETRRIYPYFLQISFMDIKNNCEHFIDEDLVINQLKHINGHKTIRDMFPGIEKNLLKECSTKEQILDVEEWFNQDLEALLMPLSYYI